jgi:hypothetical protein
MPHRLVSPERTSIDAKPSTVKFANDRVPTPGSIAKSQAWLPGLLAVVLVLIVYTWLASIGTWTDWPSNSTYYDKLAVAFRHGQLWLDLKPTALLAAESIRSGRRKGAPFLSDAAVSGPVLLVLWARPALATDCQVAPSVQSQISSLYLRSPVAHSSSCRCWPSE